jgi:hypothetical protein
LHLVQAVWAVHQEMEQVRDDRCRDGGPGADAESKDRRGVQLVGG